MKLAELAFACYIYGKFADSNSSYLQFLDNTSPQLDLNNENHRIALLNWLNEWGCRQFAIAYHGLASEEIRSWFQDLGDQFFPLDKSLIDFSDYDFASVITAYTGLVNRIASKRLSRNEGQSEVTFGPTGTAKILFAIRPNAMIPWDDAMRTNFQLDGSAGDYVKFLKKVRNNLEELNEICIRSGHRLSDLPELVGKPKYSLTKLMDEYHWVTITRNCPAPTRQELNQWALWW